MSFWFLKPWMVPAIHFDWYSLNNYTSHKVWQYDIFPPLEFVTWCCRPVFLWPVKKQLQTSRYLRSERRRHRNGDSQEDDRRHAVVQAVLHQRERLEVGLEGLRWRGSRLLLFLPILPVPKAPEDIQEPLRGPRALRSRCSSFWHGAPVLQREAATAGLCQVPSGHHSQTEIRTKYAWCQV